MTKKRDGSTLPSGWVISELKNDIRIHAGLAPSFLQPMTTGENPYVKVEDLNNSDKYQRTSRAYVDSSSTLIPKNSVIFPKRGAAIFANKVRIAAVPMVLDTNLMAIECGDGLDSEFFYYAITYAGLHQLADTSTIPQLNNKHILPYRLLRPVSIKEQRQIAAILSNWDNVIAINEKLLANSRKQKHALMSALLSGRQQIGTLNDSWVFKNFDSVFERIKRKNKNKNQNVLTISGQHGLVSQREFFNKNVASENLDGYTLIERGEFAYNKSYSAGYPMGAIKPLLAYDSGVVSSLYICFRIRDDVEADFDFFRHYFEAGFLNEEIAGIAQEGARNHGLLNVSVGDFFKLRLHIPPAPLQRKISEIINVAEAEERTIGRQLMHLKREKRTLMQQLLTGKRRVRLSEPAEAAAA